MSRSPTLHVVLLDGVTTGSATVGPARLDKLTQLMAYATYSSGVSAGQVTIEAAPFEGYTGTWSSLGTLDSGDGVADHLAITGPHLALRARVNTTVADGTVTVTLVGTGG